MGEKDTHGQTHPRSRLCESLHVLLRAEQERYAVWARVCLVWRVWVICGITTGSMKSLLTFMPSNTLVASWKQELAGMKDSGP